MNILIVSYDFAVLIIDFLDVSIQKASQNMVLWYEYDEDVKYCKSLARVDSNRTDATHFGSVYNEVATTTVFETNSPLVEGKSDTKRNPIYTTDVWIILRNSASSNIATG